MWRNPMPWKNTPETPNIGTWAQTDDMRPGLGCRGDLSVRLIDVVGARTSVARKA